MRFSRSLVLTAAGLSGVALSLISLPSAQAANLGTAPVSCVLYDGTGSFTGNPGDTFILQFNQCDPTAGGTAATITIDPTVLSAEAGVSSPYIVNTDRTITFTIVAGAPNGTNASAIVFTTLTPTRGVTVIVSGGSDSGSSNSADGAGPQSWWKAYQRATKETACNSGWNPSYAMWANSNSGGWVCVQELYYSGGSWLTR